MIGLTCEALKDLPLIHGGLATYLVIPDPGGGRLSLGEQRVQRTVLALLSKGDLTIGTAIRFLQSLPATEGWPIDPGVSGDVGEAFGYLLCENWTAIRNRLGPDSLVHMVDELQATPQWSEPPQDADVGSYLASICLILSMAYLCDRT